MPTTKSAAQRARANAARQQPAKKQAVIKQTPRGKQVAKRKAKGQFDGSVVLPGADLSHYNAAKGGNAVIQPGEPKRRRI